jgi:hypothetical protein
MAKNVKGKADVAVAFPIYCHLERNLNSGRACPFYPLRRNGLTRQFCVRLSVILFRMRVSLRQFRQEGRQQSRLFCRYARDPAG